MCSLRPCHSGPEENSAASPRRLADALCQPQLLTAAPRAANPRVQVPVPALLPSEAVSHHLQTVMAAAAAAAAPSGQEQEHQPPAGANTRDQDRDVADGGDGGAEGRALGRGVGGTAAARWAEAVVYELLRRDPGVAAGGWEVTWVSAQEGMRYAPYDILLTRGTARQGMRAAGSCSGITSGCTQVAAPCRTILHATAPARVPYADASLPYWACVVRQAARARAPLSACTWRSRAAAAPTRAPLR